MRLNTLSPAPGSTKTKNASVAELVVALEKPQDQAIKDKSLGLEVQCGLDLKVDRCLCR